MTRTAVEVVGVGAWTPGMADAEAFRHGRDDPAVTAPLCALVSPRHLRFTSELTRMAVGVFEQAVAGSGLDLATVDVIFASALGEIRIAVELLDRIAAEGGASPARFMNSVHNTVPGHLSIATTSQGAHSALAAGGQTVSAAFIEAFGLLHAPGHDHVAVVVADEALPPRLLAGPSYPPLAAGFLLRRAGAGIAGPRALARLTAPRTEPAVEPYRAATELGHNPCSPALGILDAILARRSGPVRLDRAGGEGWCLDVTSESTAP